MKNNRISNLAEFRRWVKIRLVEKEISQNELARQMGIPHARISEATHGKQSGNLINLYRCIKYHCEELQKELNWLAISREQFFDNKSQLNARGLTDIQRAARYFHIIKVSFGADRKTFGTNKKNLTNSIEYLAEVQERLKNVVIENRDFESLIRVYDRPGALFYLDPPYHGTEKYYEGGFSHDDHIRLKTVLDGIKGKFILSYNDDEFIRDLYKDYHIEGISRNSNLTNKLNADTFDEVIIKNF